MFVEDLDIPSIVKAMRGFNACHLTNISQNYETEYQKLENENEPFLEIKFSASARCHVLLTLPYRWMDENEVTVDDVNITQRCQHCVNEQEPCDNCKNSPNHFDSHNVSSQPHQERPYVFHHFSPSLGATWHRRLRWKFSAERITEDLVLKAILKGKKNTFSFVSRNLLKERSQYMTAPRTKYPSVVSVSEEPFADVVKREHKEHGLKKQDGINARSLEEEKEGFSEINSNQMRLRRSLNDEKEHFLRLPNMSVQSKHKETKDDNEQQLESYSEWMSSAEGVETVILGYIEEGLLVRICLFSNSDYANNYAEEDQRKFPSLIQLKCFPSSIKLPHQTRQNKETLIGTQSRPLEQIAQNGKQEKNNSKPKKKQEEKSKEQQPRIKPSAPRMSPVSEMEGRIPDENTHLDLMPRSREEGDTERTINVGEIERCSYSSNQGNRSITFCPAQNRNPVSPFFLEESEKSQKYLEAKPQGITVCLSSSTSEPKFNNIVTLDSHFSALSLSPRQQPIIGPTPSPFILTQQTEQPAHEQQERRETQRQNNPKGEPPQPFHEKAPESDSSRDSSKFLCVSPVHQATSGPIPSPFVLAQSSSPAATRPQAEKAKNVITVGDGIVVCGPCPGVKVKKYTPTEAIKILTEFISKTNL